jgi:hypothetical protein
MAEGSRSFPDDTYPQGWIRLLIPSVGDLIFIVLLALLTLTPLSVRLLGDAGIGWHIRSGQEILATHAIPPLDSFSSTMSGKPWFRWEWLYDLVVGGLEGVAGLNGVVFITALMIAAVFGWTFWLLVRRGTNIFVAVVLVMLAASASMIHFFARPHVVSWLLTLAWFQVLDSSERNAFRAARPISGRVGTGAWLWLLPFLMLLWVNLHGGFLVAFVLLGIYWLSPMLLAFTAASNRLEDILEKRRAGKRARDLAAVTVLAAMATLVNPYGFRLHAHIYRYLSNRFLMDHIDEFQSPNFHGVAQKCFAILLLITLLTAAAKTRRLTMIEGVVVLFAVFSGLYASRNIPIASVLLVLVVGPLLSEAIKRAVERSNTSSRVRRVGTGLALFSARMGEIESRLRGHLWAVVAFVIFFGAVANGGKIRSTQIMSAHFDSQRFPVAAVTFLEQSGGREPVLGPDYWGGYLIYRIYPRISVAVDDRHDLYGEEFLKSYLKLRNVEPGWEDLLTNYHIHRVLLPRGSAPANMLAETAEWKMIYEDEVGVIFVRTSAGF